MKKIASIASPIVIVAILLMCVSVIALPSYDAAAAMPLDNDEYDIVFLQNVGQLAAENYVGEIEIVANKEALYDLNISQIGFVYDFVVNDECGYAIVTNANGCFEVAEIYFDAVNPYSGIEEGAYIYVANLIYLYFADGCYYEACTGTILSEQIIDELAGVAYYSSGETFSSSTETIYYTSKSENKYNLAARHPGIGGVANYSNACAPVAGACIIQFWDRYYTNLIAGYTPGTALGNSYLYKVSDATLESVVIQLYNDMATNSTGAGTTIPQFTAGLNTYVNRCGYSVAFSSCMSNGSFSYANAQQQLSSGKPITLCVAGFTVADITANSNYDSINYLISSGDHMMVGFGYNEITYTLSDGTTRIDKYLAVASGLMVRERGYYNINYNTNIDDAFGVSIS